jgi:hypothetical protein
MKGFRALHLFLLPWIYPDATVRKRGSRVLNRDLLQRNEAKCSLRLEGPLLVDFFSAR